MKTASRITSALALLWTLLFVTGTSIHAQQPDRPKNSISDDTDIVTINTDLILTWAHVTNSKDGTPVQGLEVDDFVLREDDKTQHISLLEEGQPLSVVILVKGGYCGTWPAEWGFHRSHEALRLFGDDAEIALMAWEGDVVLTQPLTRDRKVIADQLEDRTFFLNALTRKQPQVFANGERYLPRPGEAIYQAAQYLEKKASPKHRKIIIIITYPDWINETHLHTAAEVRELLERTGTTVYALNQDNGFTPYFSLTSKLGLNFKDKRRRRGGTIEEFVTQTGGSLLSGKPEEGNELLIKLAEQIRSSYTIGYYPENRKFDGRFRRLSIELSPTGKAKAGQVNIKTRDGYRALRPSLPTTSETSHKR